MLVRNLSLQKKDTRITLVKRVSIISRSPYSNSVPLRGSVPLHLSIAEVLLSLWKHTYFGRKSSSILCPTHRSIAARSEMCAACTIWNERKQYWCLQQCYGNLNSSYPLTCKGSKTREINGIYQSNSLDTKNLSMQTVSDPLHHTALRQKSTWHLLGAGSRRRAPTLRAPARTQAEGYTASITQPACFSLTFSS